MKSIPANLIIENLIIGIGINIRTSEFPDEIDQIAGSLDTEGLNRYQLIARIVTGILDMIEDIDDKTFP